MYAYTFKEFQLRFESPSKGSELHGTISGPWISGSKKDPERERGVKARVANGGPMLA